MARKIKPAPAVADCYVTAAIGALRRAREYLKMADCPRTLDRVRKALKSADGAVRHVNHRIARS